MTRCLIACTALVASAPGAGSRHPPQLPRGQTPGSEGQQQPRRDHRAFSRKSPAKPSGRHDGTHRGFSRWAWVGWGPRVTPPPGSLGMRPRHRSERSWGFDGRDCERLIVSCDQSRRWGGNAPPARPQASAQTQPLHGNHELARGGPLGAAPGPSLWGLGGSPHFRAGGGGWCRLQGPAWRAFARLPTAAERCLSLKPARPRPSSPSAPHGPGGGGVLAASGGSA